MERGEWAGGRPWPRGPFGVAGNNGSINSHCSSVSFIPHIKPSIPNLSRQILKLTHFDYGMTSTAELQCTYVYDQYTDALRLSGFLAAVPIHEIIPRDNYAVSHTRLCGGTLESKLYDTCSPKLYDIDLKIASWTSLLLLALSSSQRGGLSLLPHKSNSVSPPAKLGGFPIH